jgi:hypothetical protein
MENTESSQKPEVAAQDVQPHEKTPKESFAELRKAKDDAERQAWQARKELEMLQKQHEMQLQQQQKAQAPVEDDFDYRQLEQEEFPEGKKVAKALSTIDRKMSAYEKKLQEKEVKLQALEFAVEHPDFKDVVTAENIEKYIKSDEDNREAVEKASNPLRKVYNLIKKSAAYQTDIATKQPKAASQEQKKVEEKEALPKTGSMGVRSEAVTAAAKMTNSTMTKDQKMALWKDTLAASRR